MTRTVLVIGSGIAGLTAARHARETGLEVVLATKLGLGDGCTVRAQGGIAGVVFPDDTVASHIADTLIAGAGHCDFDAVKVLCERGGESIRELARQGVKFDTDANGGWSRGLEGAHSIARIVHAGGDATGARVHEALVAAARQAGVRMLEHRMLRDLIVRDGRVVGAEFVGDGQVERIEADAVVLATGGFGALYPFTTNPASATGDGIVAAARAGAEVEDLEFVQFHPTVLAVGEPFLISEAVRGEGATLVDETGYAFMQDVDPRGDLASRDVVARAIAERSMGSGDATVAGVQPSADATISGVEPSTDATIAGTQGSGEPTVASAQSKGVYLDATGLGRDFLASRFPTIDAAVRARGLDWSRDPIPVRPGAHFAMGGVATDVWGRTSVPGLYAVGEVACTGVHGANRLASNSLLEGAVFGARVAEAINDDASEERGTTPERVPETGSAVDTAVDTASDSRTAPASDSRPTTPFTREALQALMWRHVGLIRTDEGLAEAQAQLDAWLHSPQRRTLDDQNLLELAALVTQQARARTESIGAHFRSDAATPAPTHAPANETAPRPLTPASTHALAHH